MDIIVTLTQGEFGILESWLGVGKVKPWIQHALNNKIRQRIDASILECTDRNPKKMDKQAKLKLLKGVILPTRVERDKGE
jgi:hypothetical protein